MDEVLEIIKNWDEDELIDLHEEVVNQINELRHEKANEYEDNKQLINSIDLLNNALKSIELAKARSIINTPLF